MSSPLKPINFDALRKPQTKPVANPTVETHVRPSAYQPTLTGRDWLHVALICAVVFFGCLWLFRGTPGPGPNPGPVVDVDGFHVLMVTDSTQRDRISEAQGAAINSVKVADWMKASGGKFRRYDKRDDLTDEDQVWRELMALATNPPQMVTLNNGRAQVQSVPEGIDATIQVLEGIR